MRVLIVEDDMFLGEILKDYLQELGHEKVVVSSTGSEGAQSLTVETFDCVFVDLNLPDMLGLELLDIIKSRDSSLPVIMMSGFPTMEYTIEAMRKGASDFLTKPFTLQQLALALNRVTKERSLFLENVRLKLEVEARKQLEIVNRQLAERVREQTRLFEISREIDKAGSNDNLYNSVVGLSSQVTNARKVGFFLLPPERENLVLISGQGLNGSSVFSPSIPVDAAHLLQFASGDQGPVILPTKELMDSAVAASWGLEASTASCWPLKIRGELFGLVMAFLENGNDEMPSSEMKLMDFLTKKASLAIENMALYESLVANFYGILRSLVNALEAKDPYTGKHSERVTGYAVRTAKVLGCETPHIEALQTTGHLHDLGKIGIADAILNKPDKLTSEEYKLIQQHPVIGESIVADLGLSREEAAIIRHHHERWDGGGYPDGLAGKEIPLLARIVAVADTFDAMTSKRAYRCSMSEDDALREVTENRGKQFDPEIADAFVEMIQITKDKEGK